MTASPQSMWKSKHLEIGPPPLPHLTMKSKKAGIHLESVGMKRKRMTARDYKSLFKRLRSKDIVPDVDGKQEDSDTPGCSDNNLSQSSRDNVTSNNNPNCVMGQSSFNTEVNTCGAEESSASSNEQKSLHSSLQGEDINKETSTDTVGASSISAIEMNNLNTKTDDNSNNEKNREGQILLQQKLTLEDKGAGSELDNMINEIKKRCDKRMKKLMQKHQVEIQEFHRIWEEERLKLETNHKLESVIIRFIYSEGPARLEKLNLLDSNFAKKMEEHNLLKDMQLKDLEAQQLAASNEERQKAAHWLAEANGCSSELRPVHGTLSLGPQSEEDPGCSLSSAHIPGVRDVVPTRQQRTEDKNQSEGVCMQRNDVARSNTSVSAPAEEVGRQDRVGTPSNLGSTDPQNEVGEILAVVEPLNQPKPLGTGETRCGDVPASGERVSHEIRSVELNKEILLECPETVLNEIMDCVDLVELNCASNKGFSEGDAIGLPDASVNLNDGTDGTTIGDSPLIVLISEPSEQTGASPNHCGLLQPHVPEDKTHGTLVSASQIDVTTSELTGTVTPAMSNVNAPVLENQGTLQPEAANSEAVGIVTPTQPNVETQTIENHERLNLTSIDASLSSKQSPAIEIETQINDLGKNSSQATEAAETEVLLHESASQIGGNLEMQINHLDIGSVCGVAHETTVGPSASSQSNVAIPQPVVSTLELAVPAVQQLVIDVAHLCGSRSPFPYPNYQVASWNSPSLVAEPLQKELEKMCKETAQLQKNHEDKLLQLKSECEKEMREIIAQIRCKYEVKLQDAELEFRLKKNELDVNLNKVLMHKKLTEVFGSKYLDPSSSGLPGMPQGSPFSSAQHLHELSLQHSVRFTNGASACQMAPSLQVARQPTLQRVQQQMLPCSVALLPITCQNIAAPPLEALQHAAAFSSGTTSQSQVISATSLAGNHHFGREMPATLPSIPQYPPQQVLFS